MKLLSSLFGSDYWSLRTQKNKKKSAPFAVPRRPTMRKRTRQVTSLLHYLLLSLTLSNASVFLSLAENSTQPVPSDALALLAFKSKADVRHNLIPFSANTTSSFCKWAGIQCYAWTRVVRLVIQGLDLGGVFAPNTLTRLDQLRVLSLQNNSLTGPIPDLSALRNLKTLFLDHNSFAGSFPPSILFLHRLKTLDLSHNNLTGSLPNWLTKVDRLNSLRLEWNRLNGSVPPLNQSSLKSFNVSGNNLTGAVPVTPTLLRLEPSSFSSNPGLCGEIIHKECSPGQPFFGPTSSPLAAAAAPPAVTLGLEVNGVDLASGGKDKHRPRTPLIVGFSCAVLVLVCSLLCFAMAAKKRSRDNHNDNSPNNYVEGGGGSGKKKKRTDMTMMSSAMMESSNEAEAVRREQEKELEEKVKRAQMGVAVAMAKSGSLAFCAGEAQLYSLDQLMRASAELLGRGTIGTTYKAVLDSRLIVSVKRLDAGKLAGTSREVFERHMESVGGLRHPNLVPLRAYFQAKEERLLIYDYQPNGSLYSLIHGSKSTRAKPLHWTSCLKIAEDVAQGLSYIHQAWRLVHGNLKSHNVLLGPDFEACVTDYCLSVLVTSPSPAPEDPDDTTHLDSAACKAPEIRNNPNRAGHSATSKSDVYAFGILLLELLTGKAPSQLPVLGRPEELAEWARSVRDGVDNHDRDQINGGENNKMEMLLEVAVACSLASPEQRPTMWQVMKMLQEIKDAVLMEDTDQPDHPPSVLS